MKLSEIKKELLESEDEFPVLEANGKMYALDPEQNLVTVVPGSVIA
uniref:Uncharacterized protein n=1 Tax=Micrococcus phage Kurnik TaxID=3092208 RepID=A0AAU6R5D2_9CAUD